MKKTYSFIILSLGIIVGGCSSDDETSVEPKPFVNLEVAEFYKGTQSPGDVWTWALDK